MSKDVSASYMVNKSVAWLTTKLFYVLAPLAIRCPLAVNLVLCRVDLSG